MSRRGHQEVRDGRRWMSYRAAKVREISRDFEVLKKKIRAMMGVSEDDIVSGARFDRVASQF